MQGNVGTVASKRICADGTHARCIQPHTINAEVLLSINTKGGDRQVAVKRPLNKMGPLKAYLLDLLLQATHAVLAAVVAHKVADGVVGELRVRLLRAGLLPRLRDQVLLQENRAQLKHVKCFVSNTVGLIAARSATQRAEGEGEG